MEGLEGSLSVDNRCLAPIPETLRKVP